MNGASLCGYVLVTPARNEERTLPETIESVLAQTSLPREWVIVSDQSTDRTDAIVEEYAREHPWIRLLALKDRPARNFASVVFATEEGCRALRVGNYAFLGLLDADVRFSNNYFESLIRRFALDPRLGLAGGLVVDVVNGRYMRAHQRLEEVAGAVQFFRRDCFDAIGGLVPMREGGWDAITCISARMQGYKTATFADLTVEHLKPRNVAEGNPVRRKWQMGLRDYALGNHPLFETMKCVGRWNESPLFLGAAARFVGYCWAGMARRGRVLPREIVAYSRREQVARLKSVLPW